MPHMSDGPTVRHMPQCGPASGNLLAMSITPSRSDDEALRSGRISASVGRELHAELTAWSDTDGLSLSQLVLKLLSRDVALRRADRSGDLPPTLSRALLSAGLRDEDLQRVDEELADRPTLSVTLKALAIIAGAKRPADPDASRRVGRLAMEARKDRHSPLALPLFEASSRLDPTNTRSRSVLGQLLHDTKEWRLAIAELEQVVATDAKDNHALLHLGWSRMHAASEDSNEAELTRAVDELGRALRSWARDVRNLKAWDQWRRQVDRLRDFNNELEVRELYGSLDQLSDEIRPRV